MNPTLFISHGAPNMILGDSFSKKNIINFSKNLKKPKYIIIFSAHYTSNQLELIHYDSKDLMYDFYGFEEELYQFKYKINSDKNISLKIKEKLEKEGFHISINSNRTSYDHGVWTSLALLYENLDIPVIQISIPLSFSPKELIVLGEKLKDLKNEALIVCSGGLTHNLYDMNPSTNIKDYAKDFNDYIVNAIDTGDEKKLLDIVSNELFYKNHPSSEHFLPLYIAFGSAFNKKGISFNHEIVYTNISMECFVFDK